ncbi:MAG: hypothetical protein ACJAXA_003325 [Candidatus Aldehydirespiratoraceae bacterium]
MIIVALLVLSIAAVGVFSVMLAARSKKEFAEQNEVVPGQKSPAPASWAGAHSREAKLHRRLGDAVRGARANPRFVELGLASQMNTIEAEALAIDERLVAAASLPRSHKEPAIDDLEAHVDELESTIAEMVTSVTVADSKDQLEAAVSAADIKLQALAEARAEVELIDRRAAGTGTTSVEVIEAESTETVPPPEPGTASGASSS